MDKAHIAVFTNSLHATPFRAYVRGFCGRGGTFTTYFSSPIYIISNATTCSSMQQLVPRTMTCTLPSPLMYTGTQAAVIGGEGAPERGGGSYLGGQRPDGVQREAQLQHGRASATPLRAQVGRTAHVRRVRRLRPQRVRRLGQYVETAVVQRGVRHRQPHRQQPARSAVWDSAR